MQLSPVQVRRVAGAHSVFGGAAIVVGLVTVVCGAVVLAAIEPGGTGGGAIVPVVLSAMVGGIGGLAVATVGLADLMVAMAIRDGHPAANTAAAVLLLVNLLAAAGMVVGVGFCWLVIAVAIYG